MTVSCQTWGREWGTDEMVEAMRQVRDLGVNWITIHPYAEVRGDGSVVMPSRFYDRPDWLTRPIREAHALGMKIMIKPHLAYWGSPFSWRGEIEFDDDEQWRRFFEQYEAWMRRLVTICGRADALVVGTELDRTVQRQREWRRIIEAMRTRFEGPITYSANWTDYEKVPFWDALDVIAIQAYFPLVDEPGLPRVADLDQGWSRLLDRIDAFSRRHNRKVVFAELGYDLSERAATRPWEDGGGGNADEAVRIQRRCLDAALRAVSRSECMAGVFLWKWFPGSSRNENFLMSTPSMRTVIEEHWAKGR